MTLKGAEIICKYTCLHIYTFTLTHSHSHSLYTVYPTAIGSEPKNPTYDSSAHWERTMVGHSAANMVPIVVSNRIGVEVINKSSITFYGM